MANNFGMPQTNKFMLNEASLLLGPQGSHMDLTVEDHSIGLFKNLLVNNERTFTALMAGLRQDKVDQTLTTDNWTFTGNGYEYNPRTLLYALGQQGYSVNNSPTVSTTASAAAAVGTDSLSVVSATGISVGDWIIIKPKDAENDGMAYRATAVATNTITLDRDLVSAIAVGDVVFKASIIRTNPDSCSGATYFSGKIVSAKSNCEPVVIWIPKIQVTSGLQLQFGVSDYSSIPFTLEALAPLPTDAGYADYLANGSSKVIMLTP